MSRIGEQIDGVLILDKPTGITSNRALQIVKRLFNAKKAGHTGSLDPLATGLLPICFGEATKYSQFLLDADKRYEVTAQLGVITDSGDADGKILQERQILQIDRAEFNVVVEKFLGEIEQVPSMFSALKYQGKPLYELARQGISIERKSRKITIFDIVINALTATTFSLTVHCSKGTYIRSLVEDIGLALGCGAHVTKLRRIAAGPFTAAQMIPIDNVTKQSELLPVDIMLQHLPQLILNSEMTTQLQQGKIVGVQDATTAAAMARIYNEQNQFIGVCAIDSLGRLTPQRLLRTN